LGRDKERENTALAVSVGQIKLINAWVKLFSFYGFEVGQIMMTRNDNINFDPFIEDEKAIYIINGNDILGETNNDFVAMNVVNSVCAELLVFLTSADGYVDDKNQVIKCIKTSDRNYLSFCRSDTSTEGTGGIKTKLIAIKNSKAKYGLILNAKTPYALSRALNGEDIGTLIINEEI
jgi:glutamate 5-kinase